jgi:hypothetical protein
LSNTLSLRTAVPSSSIGPRERTASVVAWRVGNAVSLVAWAAETAWLVGAWLVEAVIRYSCATLSSFGEESCQWRDCRLRWNSRGPYLQQGRRGYRALHLSSLPGGKVCGDTCSKGGPIFSLLRRVLPNMMSVVSARQTETVTSSIQGVYSGVTDRSTAENHSLVGMLNVPQLHSSHPEKRREAYGSKFDTRTASLRREASCDSLGYSDQTCPR